MVNKNLSNANAINNLLGRTPSEFSDLTQEWNESMKNGDVCYGRPIGFNTRRIYLNSAQKLFEYLEASCINLYEATVKTIEKCKPEQFSTRKHVKEAAVSLAKVLIQKDDKDAEDIREA